MKIGTFMMPLYPAGRNATETQTQDREAILLADQPGYCEAFVGELDQATPLRDSEVLVNGIPDASLVVLPSAYQSAAEFSQALAHAWLNFQPRIAERRLGVATA